MKSGDGSFSFSHISWMISAGVEELYQCEPLIMSRELISSDEYMKGPTLHVCVSSHHSAFAIHPPPPGKSQCLNPQW